MLFFYIVAALAAVLCFFMLYITFEATVRDNAWEFGVLRALGLLGLGGRAGFRLGAEECEPLKRKGTV